MCAPRGDNMGATWLALMTWQIVIGRVFEHSYILI